METFLLPQENPNENNILIKTKNSHDNEAHKIIFKPKIKSKYKTINTITNYYIKINQTF